MNEGAQKIKEYIDAQFSAMIQSEDGKDERILGFANRYVAESILKLVEGNKDDLKSGILALLDRMTAKSDDADKSVEVKVTRLAKTCFYQVFLVAVANKEIAEDADVMNTFSQALFSNEKSDYSGAFFSELTLLRGKRLLKLF